MNIERIGVPTATYPYIPTPPLPHWSDQHLLAITLANRIPPARWATFGNVSEAYNYVVYRQDRGYARQNAHTFGLLIDDLDERISRKLSGWTVPWHRLRDHEGLCRAKYTGKV